MDIETIRLNERWKALATLVDNGGLALLIAGVVRGYERNDVDGFALLWFFLGFVAIWVGWHVRGLIQSED